MRSASGQRYRQDSEISPVGSLGTSNDCRISRLAVASVLCLASAIMSLGVEFLARANAPEQTWVIHLCARITGISLIAGFVFGLVGRNVIRSRPHLKGKALTVAPILIGGICLVGMLVSLVLDFVRARLALG